MPWHSPLTGAGLDRRDELGRNAAVDIVTEFHWADPFSSCEQCPLPPPPLSSRPALARVMVEIVGPTSARISSGALSNWAASNHARSLARFSCRSRVSRVGMAWVRSDDGSDSIVTRPAPATRLDARPPGTTTNTHTNERE